jgi:hypothetical protein
MAGEIHRLRERQSESEKITINVGFVDLGHIDLLVREGSTRTEPTSSARRSAISSRPTRMR